MFSRALKVVARTVWLSTSVVASVQSVAADRNPDSRKLAGHYSMHDDEGGVAKLELRDDWRFEWRYSKDDAERYATGEWGSKAGHLFLKSDEHALPPVVFKPPLWSDWQEAAEHRLREDGLQQEIATVQERCPFLAPPGDSPAPMIEAAPDINRAGAHAGPDETNDVRNTRSRLQAATREVEEASRAAMALRVASSDAGNTEQAKAAMRRATEAMVRYRQARFDAERVQSRAGLVGESLLEAELPSECRYPPEVEQEPARADWVGGYAVAIGDSRAGVRLRNIKVTFLFDDGSQTQLSTDRDGWCAVPLPPKARVRGVKLQLPYDEHQPEMFEVAAKQGAVFDFEIDVMRLVPAFRWMDLQVDDVDLVPVGRYGPEQIRYERN